MAETRVNRPARALVFLPLRRALQTCRWACGSKCFQQPVNPSDNPTFESILQSRLARRALLKGAALSASFLVVGSTPLARLGTGEAAARGTSLGFEPISLNTEDRVTVPEGYQSQVLIRWGDPLTSTAPAFRLDAQSAVAQAEQFGYNCDFVGFFPLPRWGARTSTMGLLAVNHEYTNPELMFPNYVAGSPTREQVDIELAAHGVSIVEVRRRGHGLIPFVPGDEATDDWIYVAGSEYNRRITAETPMEITGPARGHPWLRTSDDPSGVTVRGTLNNCAGGKTPWGTLLTCEENFHQYFANLDALPDDDPRKAAHARYGLPAGATERRWELYHARFDLAQEPNEPFRFGWVVEIDPYDPSSTPRKRTALGRFKHEGATVVVNGDGRVVVYSGDDERFEYIYKFVSSGRFDSGLREANFDLLDEGTLYVAKFNDDGTGEWLPLVHGAGPLTAENGFASQADVLINTRRAADLLGATKMDRPEDIEVNPVNGKVYCVLTNNTRRQPDQVNAANPRPNNKHGHIIELTEDGNDYAATTFTWEIFMLCGDPANPDDQTYFAGFDPSLVSPISSPDNITFDRAGNLWIATDGQPGTFQKNDGIFAVPVEGPERGYLRQFLSGPRGAEICGPEFTPNGGALFCAVQHPGEGGTLTQPISTWPDGRTPPRPSVVVVTRERGRPGIGS
jgi:secreted PhoX family phosphatase